MFITPHNFIYC